MISMGLFISRVLRSAVAIAILLTSTSCAGGRFGRTLHYVSYFAGGRGPTRDCWQAADYRACAYRSRSGRTDSRGLLYFFHYAEGDERSFDRIGLAHSYFGRLAEKNADAPVVVSVSFGTHWLIANRPGKREVVRVERFQSVMRDVEARLGVPERRYLWGMSMGGYNAVQMALARPADWRAGIVSCPALLVKDPFNSNRDAKVVEDGKDLFRYRLGGSKDWSEENPITLAGKASAGVPLMIQPNASDEYGFEPGARALAAAMNGRAVLSPAAGGHCIVNAPEAADFTSQWTGNDRHAGQPKKRQDF